MSIMRVVETWWMDEGNLVPEPFTPEYQDMIDAYLEVFDASDDQADMLKEYAYDPFCEWRGDGYDYTYAPRNTRPTKKRKSKRSVMSGKPNRTVVA